MLARISIALLAFILAGMAPLHAQDQPVTQDQTTTTDTLPPIATDRPTVTNSSIVVPVGHLQLENGFLYTSTQGQTVVDATETLLRFGVAARTELRLTVPDYYYNLNGVPGNGSGFGDLAIGIKEQLGPTPGGFDVSATLFLSLPTGAQFVSSGGYDPGLQVAWSRGLSAKWTAGGMFSFTGPRKTTREI
jgi:hypothetical protein